MTEHLQIKIEGDSKDYDVFESCIQDLKQPLGRTLEIGVRRGYGSACIIEAFRKYHPESKLIHIGIDPYGDIPYNASETHKNVVLDYSNDMKKDTLVAMTYRYPEFHLACMTDTEYMERFHDGFPIYQGTGTRVNAFDLIHFDGPHDVLSVLKEVLFFENKLASGGFFVFDDVGSYDQNLIEHILLLLNFTPFIKKERKHAWKKI